MDIGDGDTPTSKYATQFAAIEHIDELIGKSLLPPPTILNSGNGLHLIWSLYDELDEQQWRHEAQCLKTHLLAIGLRIDAQRTTDFSNGPRVPGTINSKGGELVSIARWSGTSWTAKAWAQTIPRLAETAELATKTNFFGPTDYVPGSLERKIAAKSKRYDNDLSFSGAEIANSCAQMAAFRDGAHLREPEWSMLVNVLAHCHDGKQLAHEWSEQDDRYSFEETEGRLERFKDKSSGSNCGGPTTCEWFRSNNPSTCAGCPNKVHSPIALGKQAGNGVSAVEARVEGSDPSTGSNRTWAVPSGYFVKDGYIYKHVIDDSPTVVCSRLFCTGISIVDGNRFYKWESISGKASHNVGFNLPRSCLNTRTADFIDKIWYSNPASLEKYIVDATRMIEQQYDIEAMHKAFGWHKENAQFLLGTTLYSSGATEKSNLWGDALRFSEFIKPAGTQDAWQKAMAALCVNGLEPHAFLLCLSAGAPLHHLVAPDEGGLTVVLRSNASGRGKTTALAAAMSIWGPWRKLGVSSSSTLNSHVAVFKTLRNLPVAWDELAVRDLDALNDRVFQFADGQDRARSNVDGSLRQNVTDRWSTYLLATSNTEVRRKLSAVKGVTEGVLARVLELEAELPPDVQNLDGGALLSKFDLHYGHAGPKLIEAMLANEGALGKIREAVQRKIVERMTRLEWGNEMRFAARALACAEVGGLLLQKLCLPELNVARTIASIEERLNETFYRDKVITKENDPVNYFIRENLGSLILVSPGVSQPPLRRISGRYEITSAGACLSVPLREWMSWCASQNKSERELLSELDRRGHSVDRKQVDITNGTTYPPIGKDLCIVIAVNSSAVSDVNDVVDEQSKVVYMRRGPGRPRLS
ncbi:MAG: DUF927 domain-containing protein [Nitrososphaera sp.]|nr:DUF927 domain-containing protein [Nitrososphaera sp.]